MTARRLMFVLFTAFGLLAALTAYGTYYTYDLLKTNVGNANKIKIEAEVNDQAQDSLRRVEAQFSDPDVTKLHDAMQQIIPDASYRSQIIGDIYQYADQYNIDVSGLTFDPVAAATAAGLPPGTESSGMSISTAGEVSYADFTGFVKRLENNLQYIDVQSISMTPNPENPDMLASFSVSIVVYTKNGASS